MSPGKVTSSDVRNIESLERFRNAIVGLSGDWEKSLQEVQMLIQRADEYFSSDRPKYWKHQTALAERELTEAQEILSQKRASVRPEDRPAATEAAKRVNLAKERVRVCQQKSREARSISIEISRQCDTVLGPLADVVEHCEVLLPAAARQLQTMINQLRDYADQSKESPDP